MRTTPLSQMLLDNLACFPPEQLEKIMNMEPENLINNHQKAKYGVAIDNCDFHYNGTGLLKSRD